MGAKTAMSVVDEPGDWTAWDSYLESLSRPGSPLPSFQAKQVRNLWEALRRSVGERLTPPHAAPAEGQVFAMSWDRGSLHFEIEILSSGEYDWFYMDRESEERAGEEKRPLGLYSSEMIAFLRRTLAL